MHTPEHCSATQLAQHDFRSAMTQYKILKRRAHSAHARRTLSVVRVEPGGRLMFLLVFRWLPAAKARPSKSRVFLAATAAPSASPRAPGARVRQG